MLINETWIKIIDFGMAKRLYVDNIGFSLSTSTMVGTVKKLKKIEKNYSKEINVLFFKVPFMAPEVRNFQSYNSKADIFSIGALIFDMANGK